MNQKDYQKAMLELEQSIRERCVSRVVKNDGTELAQLLKNVCLAGDVTHVGGFMFSAKHSRAERILVFTEPVNGGEEYIRIVGYSIEPKKDAGIVPIFKDADIGDADAELVAFARTIDFRALWKQIKAICRVFCEFGHPEIVVRKGNICIEFQSTDISGQSGPFSAILKNCYIHSFSNGVFRDKETNEPKYWVTVDIRYEHKGGGENGMEIGRALYNNGEWEFTGSLQGRENRKNSPLPSSLF